MPPDGIDQQQELDEEEGDAPEGHGERSLAATPRKAFRWSQAETRNQEATIEEALYGMGVTSHRALATLCERKWGRRPSQARVAVLIKRITARWAAEDSESRPRAKATAVRRLFNHVNHARLPHGTPGSPGYVKPNWSAVARFEELLADIQGTREPVRVSVDVQVTEALTQVVASLTDEQIEQRLHEMDELERLADIGRRALAACSGVVVSQAVAASNGHSAQDSGKS